ncbi:MAG: hypothetical protein ACO3UU_07800 [Minisyncoccia bacterium]
MTELENQIIDLEKLILLAQFDSGAYEEVGCIYYPRGYTHNYIKFFRYQGFNKYREDYDFSCDSFETLQDFVGLDLILFQSHRPITRSNKACLFQTLDDSRKELKAGEYTRVKMAIEELPYYTYEVE